MLGKRGSGLDASRSVLRTSDGESIAFGRCLVATGRPKAQLPRGLVDPQLLRPRNAVASGKLLPLCRPGRGDEALLEELILDRHHVSLVGNGVETLRLAGSLATAARQGRRQRRSEARAELRAALARAAADGGGGGGGGGGGAEPEVFALSGDRRKAKIFKQVAVVTPEPSPLSRITPNYLWGPLERRLRRVGVEVHSHSHVRYVSRDASASRHNAKVYLSCVYDSLDTNTIHTGGVAVMPPDSGTGIAAEPPLQGARVDAATDGLVHLQVDPSTGALLCDQSLNAAPRVWAAGSAAVTSAAVAPGWSAGGGGLSPALSGEIAAHNMLVDACRERGGAGGAGEDAYRGVTQARSRAGDMRSIGVSARWIGDCDTRLESHGFWWRPLGESGAAYSPVLGAGVVYFMHPNGSVGGVLLWGLDHGRPEGPVADACWDTAEAMASAFVASSKKWRKGSRTRVELMQELHAESARIVRKSASEVSAGGAARPVHRFALPRAARDPEPLFSRGKRTRNRSDVIADAYSAGIRGQSRAPASSDGVNPFRG